MAITIDHLTKEIHVLKSYSTFNRTDPITGLEIRTLDVDTFGKDLYDLQDNTDEVWAATAFEYTQAKTVGNLQLAPVLIILSPYRVTFENGTYALEFANANTNIADVVTVNNVSIRPNNSAGLVGAEEITNQSYLDGKVFINTSLGLPNGAGTPTDPVNTFPLAYTVASNRKLIGYDLVGTLSLGNTDNVVGERWVGQSPITSVIVATNLDISMSSFDRIGLTGSLSNSPSARASFNECTLGGPLGMTNFFGVANNCGINGNITLWAGVNDDVYFGDCKSVISGNSKWILDCNNVANINVHFRNYNGGVEIRNFVSGSMSIDGPSMRIRLDSSCTGGEIVIGGTFTLDDASVGTTVITGSQDVWSETEKQNVITYSRNASEKSESADLKL